MGHEGTIAYESWPTYDEKALVVDFVEIPVQILGKVRGTIKASINATEEEVVALAKDNAEISKYLTAPIKKVIYVPKRILNFII